MTENYLLEVKNVSKSFGVVKALNRIDFNVRPNEIHALCGENGAGKSTLMNILSGVYPYGSYGGEVYYDGELCKFRNVRESEKKNIAIIHQHLALFPALSIAENIFLGNENAKNSVIDWKLTIRRAAELMERVGLHENPETKIRDLGVGKQQLVEICKAISKNVRLLILDEPTAALNDEESALLLELMRKFRQEGISCIFITHKLHEIKVLVTPTWKIEGAVAKVEACNNGFDAVPTWEDITAMVQINRVYNFTNKTKTASKWGVNIRFTITKNEGFEGEVSISGFGGAYE